MENSGGNGIRRTIGGRAVVSAFLLFAGLILLIASFPAGAASTEHASVTARGGYVILETEHTVMTVTQQGYIADLFNKIEKEKYTVPGSVLAYLTKADGSKVYPAAMTAQILSGTSCKLDIRFSDGYTAVFYASAYDDYITFQLAREESIPDSYTSLVLLPITFAQNYMNDDDFMAYHYVLHYNTYVTLYPGSKVVNLSAAAYTRLDTAGAGVAFIACPQDIYRDVLKDVNDHIVDPDIMIKTDKGGANAYENEGNFGDYVIISTSNASDIDEWKTYYVEKSIDQIDFHQGGGTFRQGDFYFYNYGGLASGFKTSVSDRLKEVGIESGLHTYAFYINPACTDILTDPVYQQQLDYSAALTLSQSITASAGKLYVEEDISLVPLKITFGGSNSLYLLVDQEIIKFSSTTGGYFTVQRGLCGTTAAAHSAGAEVRLLMNVWYLFAPQPDSDLFLQIARNTARAYVEGGFGMIYIDAFDGISRHTSDGWYYCGKYETEMLNEIRRLGGEDPILEHSTMYTSLWYGRSRDGAWDHGTKSYRKFVQSHIESNEVSVNTRLLSAQLGWYHLYPSTASDYYGGFQVKYHSAEEAQYTGTKMLAYNNGISYNGLLASTLAAFPALDRNVSILTDYQRLRKTKYFSQRVIEQLKDFKKDFELVEVSPGEWKFYEKYYKYHKFNDITAQYSTFSDSNPYAGQQPFIRIEGLFSSNTDITDPEAFLLFDFDPTQSIISQMTTSGRYRTVNLVDTTVLVDAPGTNLTGQIAIKTRVYGNGKGGAVMIRIQGDSLTGSGYADRMIPIDFTGWRELTLVEVDNGFYDYTFTGASMGGYAYLRNSADFSNCRMAGVYTAGDMTGVMMDDVYCVPYTATSYVNPTVTINGRSVTFQTTLSYTLTGSHYATTFIEYTPGQPTAKLYDEKGNATDVSYTLSDPVNGMFVGSGGYSASFSCDSLTAIPGRILMTLGFTGGVVADKLYVTEVQSEGGVIYADAPGGIEDGTDVTVEVLPDAGYKLKSDGLTITYTIAQKTYTKTVYRNAQGKFSFSMPDANVTLQANFIPKDNVNFIMIGAGIRLSDSAVPQGLRFLTRFSFDTEGITVVESGTLLIPSKLLSGSLTLQTENALNIVRTSHIYYSYTPYYFEYTGVLVNIPEREYKTDITARSYIKYRKEGESREYIAYSDPLVRNVYNVARAAIKDSAVSPADKALLQDVVDRYEYIPEGDNDGGWKW